VFALFLAERVCGLAQLALQSASLWIVVGKAADSIFGDCEQSPRSRQPLVFQGMRLAAFVRSLGDNVFSTVTHA
jgi:hypothetical protein